ncbi:MAG: TIGR00266 family protein [Acidimicrobiaceae bacterium]|nr:TIGR00266 family protein [Acidimicrobiia bacterium]MCY4494177.1 TIGR00266 family protein [Acidimicrobiaceae bacterium]
MQSHEIDYQIHGDDLQFVEIELDPGEVVIAEAGAMMYIEQGITFESKMGDGSDADEGKWSKFKSAAKRSLSGESVFLTHFTNSAAIGRQKVAMAAPYPGKVLPVDLHAAGGRILAQKDAFLCAASGTKLDVAFNKKLGTGLFGGEGFILQDISGDGLAFLHAGGTIVRKRLQGETLRVDTGCLVAFQPEIQYSIERAGNLKSMVFGGEGMFLATLTGVGDVWLQSLPFNRLADRVLANLTPGGSDGEGSVIGGLSNIFERN